MFFLQFNKFTQFFTAAQLPYTILASSWSVSLTHQSVWLSFLPGMQYLMQCRCFFSLWPCTQFILTLCTRPILNLATNDSLINCHTVMRFKLSCLYSNVRRLSKAQRVLSLSHSHSLPLTLPLCWWFTPSPIILWVVGLCPMPDAGCPMGDGWWLMADDCGTMVNNQMQSHKTKIEYAFLYQMMRKLKDEQSSTLSLQFST